MSDNVNKMQWTWGSPISLIRWALYANNDQNDSIPQEVVDDGKLYIGSINSINEKVIMDLSITHIVSCVHWIQKPSYPTHVVIHHINVWDTQTTQINECFLSAIQFIENALNNGGSVLVHCNAGRSRSASIILAYLMYRFNTSFEDALRHLKSRRSVVQPNPGFIRQLKQWEDFLQTIRNQGVFSLIPSLQSSYNTLIDSSSK